ncbi:RNA-splicing factor, partial [Ceratobasidium sp. 392]
MGGGDLNMKKSWNPHLIKNRVGGWREEKKDPAEKKELDQLRKELEEERQRQELQRLQEAQTGNKKFENLERIHAAPATGEGRSTSELEDYLLGKKRVDQTLTGDEAAKACSIIHTNTDRDTTAKVCKDPVFAIEQQEQTEDAAYMSNPLRSRAMKGRTRTEENQGKDEEERKRLKEKKKERRYRAGMRITIDMDEGVPIQGINVPCPQNENGYLKGHPVSMTRLVVLDMTPHHTATLITPRDGTIVLTTLLPATGLVLVSDTEEVAVGVAAVTIDPRGRPIIPPVELPHLVSERTEHDHAPLMPTVIIHHRLA